MNTIESSHLAAYRARAGAWLAKHAPAFSGSARSGLGDEADVALARAWQALKAGYGYACITVPKCYGGAGGTEIEKSIFAEEELAYDLPTVYHIIGLSNPLPMFLRYASEERRREIGPPSVRGEHIWCQLFSEPSAGSDLAALRLRAVPVGADAGKGRGPGWLLNGQKLWTSWAHLAQWGLIVTRTDPTVPKHAGLTCFYLDMQSPGISVRPIRRTTKSDVCEVYFDSVFVPDDQRMGAVGAGFKVAIETLMIERYAVSDETAGGVPLEQFIDLAGRTMLNGVPALEDGEVRAEIARVFVERQGLRSIHRRAMRAMAAGQQPGPEGAIRKLLLARTRQRLGALALDLMGAEGVFLDPLGSSKTDFAGSWLDPNMRVAGGTDEILLSTLAERVLGLPQDHRPDKGIPFNQLP